MEYLVLFRLPGLPPPRSLTSSLRLKLCQLLSGYSGREGHPLPEFYAQEVSLTLWSKNSLKEAPHKQKQKTNPGRVHPYIPKMGGAQVRG